MVSFWSDQYFTINKAPFVVTSNGWFGAWGGLIATVKWSIGLKNSLYTDKPEGLKQLINITICSIILLFASVPPLVQKWEHYGGAGFAIAGAALTLIGCAYLITMYDDVPRNIMKITSVMLFVLWTSVAGVCTFHRLFLITSEFYVFVYFTSYIAHKIKYYLILVNEYASHMFFWQKITDNGFFACWLGCLAALNLLVIKMKDSKFHKMLL